MTAREEIERTVRDDFEGWFDAGAARMDRALHRDLVERALAVHLIARRQRLGASES